MDQQVTLGQVVKFAISTTRYQHGTTTCFFQQRPTATTQLNSSCTIALLDPLYPSLALISKPEHPFMLISSLWSTLDVYTTALNMFLPEYFSAI